MLARPPSDELKKTAANLAGVLICSAGAGGLVAAVGIRFRHLAGFAHPALLLSIAGVAVAIGLWCFWVAATMPDWLEHGFGLLILVLMVVVPLVITAAQFAVGPLTEIVLLLYVEVPIFAFWLLRRPLAVGIIGLVVGEFGAVVVLQLGYPYPAIQIPFVALVLATIAYVFGSLISRGEEEATRLARMRRFLSPHVADAVVTTAHADLLEPHRRRIAVFFIDLRGFTHFSATAEPEEILDVLDEYFRTVGTAIRDFDATVGMLAGDGIMGYFGDPLPCEDAADRAVALATAVREPMGHLAESWGRKGFAVSYGIGIAYGYATLGVVGFEGRNDYTALGSVVNLAARLSDAAAPGEILVDARAIDALATPIAADART